MQIIGLSCLISFLVFTNVFSQQSNAPATPLTKDTLPRAVAGGAVKAPVQTTPQVSTKTSSTTPEKHQQVMMNPVARKAIAQASALNVQRKACDSKYGKEISERTGDLRKKLMDLMQSERAAENKKRQNSAVLRQMPQTAKQLRAKDSLAYRDTSANRVKRRQDVQNERMAAMKKMRMEEAKIQNDPEINKIRQNIAALRKQIDDTISVIVKNDQNCLSCYKK